MPQHEPSEQSETSFANRPEVFAATKTEKVKVWTNQGKNGEFLSASFEHSYKDANDHWQTQQASIPKEALLAVARAMKKAHDHIITKEQSQGRSHGQER
jgi:hypothetical protein